MRYGGAERSTVLVICTSIAQHKLFARIAIGCLEFNQLQNIQLAGLFQTTGTTLYSNHLRRKPVNFILNHILYSQFEYTAIFWWRQFPCFDFWLALICRKNHRQYRGEVRASRELHSKIVLNFILIIEVFISFYFILVLYFVVSGQIKNLFCTSLHRKPCENSPEDK